MLCLIISTLGTEAGLSWSQWHSPGCGQSAPLWGDPPSLSLQRPTLPPNQSDWREDIWIAATAALQESASAQAKAKCDENQPPSFPSPFPVHHFVLQSFRTVKCIKKYGNCLFRAVAFHTLGDEDKHDDIRTLLGRFKNLNKALSESWFVPSANATSFHDHLKHQLWPGISGTQVELMATATLFQVPV